MNSTIKSLSIARGAALNKTDAALNCKSLQFLLKGMGRNYCITTLRLENFAIPNEVCQTMSALLKMNESIVQVSCFACELSTTGLAIIAKGIEDNVTLRCFSVFGTAISPKDLPVIDKSLSSRQAPLTLRLNDEDHFFGKGEIHEEWEIDDKIEACDSKLLYAPCRIVAVVSGEIYHVIYPDGKEDEAVDCRNIRKGSHFVRVRSLVDDLGAQGPVDFSNEITDTFRGGDEVEIRYYGDCIWYRAKVLSVDEATDGLLTMMPDDDPTDLIEVESHMMRSPLSSEVTEAEAVRACYDAGVYERGDYVEVKIDPTKNRWRRGRVAMDNCNGTYEVRMEDGSDEHEIPGRSLRSLFKKDDKIDARPFGSEWIPGKIVRNEKDGNYTVEFESGTASCWQQAALSAR